MKPVESVPFRKFWIWPRRKDVDCRVKTQAREIHGVDGPVAEFCAPKLSSPWLHELPIKVIEIKAYEQLEKEILLTREENEKLMNVEYWPERAKVAEKKVSALTLEIEMLKSELSVFKFEKNMRRENNGPQEATTETKTENGNDPRSV